MKKRLGTGITLFVALIFFLINLPASPAWAGDVEINATNFPDATFRTYVSTEFDENNDATLSQEELDAVTNIDVRSKGITTLKGVEHFTNLRLLHCGSNQLTSLNVSQNTRLENLYCSENQLIALDVSQNPNLEVLVCYKNQLTTLDVSQNTDLTDLDCSENKLTSLDYTNNVSLTNFKGTDQTADIFVAQDALIFNLAS